MFIQVRGRSIAIRDRPKLHFSFSAETKLAPKLIFWLGRKRKRHCVYIRFIKKKNIGRQTATRIHEQEA